MNTICNDDSTVTWRKTCNDCGCQFVDSMRKLGGIFPVRVKDFKVNTGTCETCQNKSNLGFKNQYFASELHWTFETVKEYFTNNPPFKGQELLILDTSHNMNTYALVTVENPCVGPQKRIVINHYSNGYSGQSFYRTGKNCYSPKGQVKLLPYNTVIGGMVQK